MGNILPFARRAGREHRRRYVLTGQDARYVVRPVGTKQRLWVLWDGVQMAPEDTFFARPPAEARAVTLNRWHRHDTTR